MSNDCNHPRLKLIEGALHPSGYDYQCLECHEFFTVRLSLQTIGVSFGSPTKTIYTVPLHVGENIEVPKGSKVTYY